MNPNRLKNTTEKAANIMIVVMVIAGTVAFALINHVSDGTELMTKLFLAFLGAIITIQLIPGMVLLGAMLKGLLGLGRKHEVTVESTKDK